MVMLRQSATAGLLPGAHAILIFFEHVHAVAPSTQGLGQRIASGTQPFDLVQRPRQRTDGVRVNAPIPVGP